MISVHYQNDVVVEWQEAVANMANWLRDPLLPTKCVVTTRLVCEKT